jgi:hypothetical protein
LQLLAILNIYFFQVLTGEFPLRGVRPPELGYSVAQGLRPAKPVNASSIGFSDLLWGFVQRCWDGDMNKRPKVAEVVAHLKEAATNWNSLMPPCVFEIVVSNYEEEMSDSWGSTRRREFEAFAPLRYRSSSDGTGPTESQTTFERLLIGNTLSTRDRISLITTIFSDHDQVEMVGNLCGDDAQSFIDVIDEVSVCTPHLWGTGWLTRTQTSVPRRLGVGQPRITAPQEVSAHFAQDLWPPSPAPEITGNSTPLRFNGGTTVSRRVCGRVEVSI